MNKLKAIIFYSIASILCLSMASTPVLLFPQTSFAQPAQQPAQQQAPPAQQTQATQTAQTTPQTTASSSNLTTESNKTADAALKSLLEITGLILSIANLLLWPLLTMIGALMGNDLVFGPNVEDRLLLIWGQLRNFVNLAAVLVLVGVAIYNVLGLGEDGNYGLKKILPKFILGLVLVNFTFFGAKMILSASSILNTAVFALPNSIELGMTGDKMDILARKTCGNIYSDTTASDGEKSNTSSICTSKTSFSPQAQAYFAQFSGDNIAFLMAINLGNISDIANANKVVSQAPTIKNVSINIIVSVIVYIVYFVSYIALFIVLVGRIIALWFLIAASPVLVLQMTVPDLMKSVLPDINLQDMFIKHAFAPTIIGLGMTIGYLMLDAFQQNTAGSLGMSLEVGADFANVFSIAPNGIQELLIGIASAVIVWKVTFTASEGTITSAITGSIRSTVSGYAKRLASIPKFQEFIPVPEGLIGNKDGKASLDEIGEFINKTIDDQTYNKRQGNATTGELLRYIKGLKDSKGFQNPNTETSIINAITTNNTEITKAMTIGNLKRIIQNPQLLGYTKTIETDLMSGLAGKEDTLSVNDFIKNLEIGKRNTFAANLTKLTQKPETPDKKK